MGPTLRPQAGLKLVAYDRDCLERSWYWLNDPETRALTMTPVFTREQQRAFFESLPERPGYWIRGVALDSFGPIGATGLKNPRATRAEYWGYIGEKRFRGGGLGTQMMQLVEAEALRLGFTSLDLKVARDNARAIALYNRRGFVETEAESTPEYLTMLKDAL